MELTNSNTLRINKYKAGLFLACLYIFASYIAQDLFLSSRINSLCLYVFLAFSAYVFITKFSASKSISVFACWCVLFFIASCLTALYSPNFASTTSSLYLMFVAFCLCVFFQLYTNDESGFSKIAWCYSISGFILIALLFLTGNLVGDADHRLGSELVGNSNSFAAMMMVATMYSIWLWVYKIKKWLPKLLMLAIIVAYIYTLALSGGRKFFIVPFLFLYLLLFFKTNKRGKRNILLYTALFAVVVSIVWSLIMNVEIFYNAIGVRMENLLKAFAGMGGDNSSQVRETIRQLAFEKWLERPLFGYGYDSFKYLALQRVGQFFYSHCNYTELLYSGGILYAALFYWIYYKILKNAFRNKVIPVAYKAFAFAVVISWLVFDYGAVSYNLNPTMIMLMMAYNASTFANKETKENGQTANAEVAVEK